MSESGPTSFPLRIALTITSENPDRRQEGIRLAERLGVSIVEIDEAVEGPFDFLLVVSNARLGLREGGRGGKELFVDFAGGAVGYRRKSGTSLKQPLARAVGLGGRKRGASGSMQSAFAQRRAALRGMPGDEGADETSSVARGKRLRVMDATAGLAADSFLLASLGCEVVAVERSAALAALVADGLARARGSTDASLREVVERIRLVEGDSREVLAWLAAGDGGDGIGEMPEVIYLDPMYPVQAKSALSRKEIRICRRLVGDDADAGALLEWARSTAAGRVVVKRHRTAPPLAPAPSMQFEGRSVRYDVYLRRAK